MYHILAYIRIEIVEPTISALFAAPFLLRKSLVEQGRNGGPVLGIVALDNTAKNGVFLVSPRRFVDLEILGAQPFTSAMSLISTWNHCGHLVPVCQSLRLLCNLLQIAPPVCPSGRRS